MATALHKIEVTLTECHGDRVTETYTIESADDLFFDVGGLITDAPTGITYAVSKNGMIKVALGVPLCAACDEPVNEHGDCPSCSLVVRLSDTRIAA